MSGWERLAFVNTRTQTTNANDTLDTGTFPARKYLHIESFYKYFSERYSTTLYAERHGNIVKWTRFEKVFLVVIN